MGWALSLLVVAVVTASGCATEGDVSSEVTRIEPAVTFDIGAVRHFDRPVVYEQTPPAGGDHNPVWQNCGFYGKEVPDVTAVHSLEHGAVWITFDPAVTSIDVVALARYAENQSHVLISPFPALDSPIIATAWGVQQRFQTDDREAIVEFIKDHQLSTSAPEPGAPCTGGFGSPE